MGEYEKEDFTEVKWAVCSWISTTRYNHKTMRRNEDVSGGARADNVKTGSSNTPTPDDGAAGDEASSTNKHDEWSEEESEEHGPQIVDVTLDGEGESDKDNSCSKQREQARDNEVEDKRLVLNDGDFKDSHYTWNFCQGNLAVLLWNDMVQTKTGGDDIADIVIPDAEVGFGSNVPGGPGNTPTVPKGKVK